MSMKSFLLMGCLGIAALPTSAAWSITLPPHAAAKVPATVVQKLEAGTPQEVIVLFDDASLQKEVAAMREAAGLTSDNETLLSFKKKGFDTTKSRVFSKLKRTEVGVVIDYSHLPMAFVKIKDGRALQRFLSDPDVVAVYENVAHEATLPQSLALINQPIAQSFGKTGRGTMVAVLDTGLDWTQPGFDGVFSGWGCTAVGGSCKVRVAIDFAPNDGVRDDFSMHGTNVAGIVAGVAPQTYFAALDVFSGGVAQTAHILAAINWVVQNARPHNIVAMNLSLGTNVAHGAECGSSWATSAFQNARSAGVIPVVASGNNGFLSGISEPACAPGAVRVGAVYDSNVGSHTAAGCTDATTAADKVACFSNSASFLTLLAPGARITAAGITRSGTSMAAPHVAGAVAVLRASNGFPGDTLDNTVGRMVNSGVPVRDHRNGIIKPRLNLGRALGLN